MSAGFTDYRDKNASEGTTESEGSLTPRASPSSRRRDSLSEQSAEHREDSALLCFAVDHARGVLGTLAEAGREEMSWSRDSRSLTK
ncbi:hypothetical protein MRB53_038715 [Persea americana]|nr:hypothetical protein MRB53_038715 [Persea americana]